jgi:hypothetical protein
MISGGETDDDDDDDVSLDSFDNEPFEDTMRRLGTNDPSLTTLRVGLDGHQPPNRDWGSLGRAIGMNTQLIKLTLRNGLPTSEHQLASFFSGLAVNRSIQTLKFDHTQLNGYMVELMAPFLAENHVFDCFEFGGLHALEFTDIKTILLGVTSFLLMFDYLREFRLSDEGYNDDLDIIIQALTVHTGLRKLVLNSITIGRRGCDSLVKLLNRSTRLKEIVLTDLLRINDDGWQDIFTALQSTRCKLEKIELRGVERLNERNALCLSDALLPHSTTLKILHSNEGLRVVIPLLQDPNAILEELGLVNDDAPITNEELEALTDALETNSSLKILTLLANNSISTDRLMDFFAVLLNPTSKLEILVLYDSHINDTVMNSFADALTNNHKLQQLCFGNCDSVNGGYAALTRTLCNKSSILSTYHSNHTLNMLYAREFPLLDGSMFLPEELTSLLQINKYNNMNQAARLKIIKTHFSGNDIKMEPFTKMTISVRPHAIAWMAKDMHLYRFLRAMPSLLEKVENEAHMVI